LTERREPPSIQFAIETSTFLSFLRAKEVFGGGGILVMTRGGGGGSGLVVRRSRRSRLRLGDAKARRKVIERSECN
jgi:hypothetical protein